MRFLVLLSSFAVASVCAVLPDGLPPGPRIAGGDDAAIGEFPYHVSLLESFEKPLCNGALLDEYWVITSARCVHKYRTVAGLLIRVATDDQGDGGNMYPATNVIEHDAYGDDFVPGVDDIALVKSSSAIRDNGTGQVSLPDDELQVGDVVTVTGFGSLNSSMEAAGDDDSYSEYLRQVNVTVWSHVDCARAYGSAMFGANTFCAGEEGRGACAGDFGGPAVINGTIYAVYSFGQTCGSGEYPGVYTKVLPYVRWIEEVMATMT